MTAASPSVRPGRAVRLAMRAAVLVPAVLLAVPLTAVTLRGVPATVLGCAAAGGVHHVAVVVEHADGEPGDRVCVGFDAASITGEQALRLSGIPFQVQSYGSYGDALCQVDDEPAQYQSCFSGSGYWAFFAARGGGAWSLSTVGISNQEFADGDAAGFRYDPQSGAGSGDPPPSPAGICPAAAATTPPAGAATPPATGATGAAGVSGRTSGGGGGTGSAAPAPATAGGSAAAAAPGAAGTSGSAPTGAGGNGREPAGSGAGASGAAPVAAVRPRTGGGASAGIALAVGAAGALLALLAVGIVRARAR